MLKNKLTSVVCLGSALALSACGGPEAEDGAELSQQSARLTTASSQGCDYEATTVQITTSPPQYNIVITRTGGASCTLTTGQSVVVQTVPLAAPGTVSLSGSSMGLAVGFTMKNGWSGSAATVMAVRAVDPTTLSTTRNADIYCDYMTGSILTGGANISANGTDLSASGTKACKIGGKSGTYWVAKFTDFFTTTTPPVITTI
ncbi:hypothetical protein D7X55_14855 [Corallococcus sp. AB049A]|uniref:Lipoprotein n=1 Tax=Corallococcus interemptor TaxID=2316720 RepID=A0A3A8PX94_9BACT|nr:MULTISPECIES: hypothetical protein [Corallococcus]RKH43335.1 hypothetical protein D7Y23_29525 [Corallococcus sp. AB050B]RKH61097.1 hypothetical protein D7X96_32375 [Corallococcus interemptor]RKI66411.1 hypothetical protein D7X55_14855 [Corallococcus sp. AB049A]